MTANFLQRNAIKSCWAMGLGLAVVGCATVRPTVRSAEMVIYAKFPASLQAVVNPLSLSSIATLDIVPYIEVSTNVYSPISSLTGNPTVPEAADILKLTQASPSIDPNRPFIIRKLKPNKKYRVVGRAYNGLNALISQDALSYVDVAVDSNDAPTMASLPVQLNNIPFGANTAVSIKTSGRYDYLKTALYLVSNGAQIMVSQTARYAPTIELNNLQGNTTYRLVAEGYKFGGVFASSSVDLAIANENAPATASLVLNVPYLVTTLAGIGTASYLDATGTLAAFNRPYGLAMDTAGNLYVGDRSNHRIRMMAPNGAVSTFAGSGSTGTAEGQGNLASFNQPAGLVMDSSSNLYVTDMYNNRIRKITAGAVTSTFAGSGSTAYAEGSGTAAGFNRPFGIALDGAGNLYVTEYSGHRVRKINPVTREVTTIAGSGATGSVDASGTNASFNAPAGIALNPEGDIFVSDYNNNCIRKISVTGAVTTFAGSGGTITLDGTGTLASIYHPEGLAIDPEGNLFIAENGNNLIRRVTREGVVTTVAGNGQGSGDGTGTGASFNRPVSFYLAPNGYLYLTDFYNHNVRVLR